MCALTSAAMGPLEACCIIHKAFRVRELLELLLLLLPHHASGSNGEIRLE
jgi:hypothetical protein